MFEKLSVMSVAPTNNHNLHHECSSYQQPQSTSDCIVSSYSFNSIVRFVFNASSDMLFHSVALVDITGSYFARVVLVHSWYSEQ